MFPINIKDSIRCVIAASILFAAAPAFAQELTSKDIQVIGRAIGFIDNGPAGNVDFGIVYDSTHSESLSQKNQLLALLSKNNKAGRLLLNPIEISVNAVSSAEAPIVFLTEGVATEEVFSSIRGSSVVVIGSNQRCLSTASCVMVVRSVPKIEIMISRSASEANGVSFKPAFQMMIREY